MGEKRFQPSSIKNKIKRQDVLQKHKRDKRQEKLQKRLQRAKEEAADPLAKKKRQEENVPKTLDNTREFDPSFLTANCVADVSKSSDALSVTEQPMDEMLLDINNDQFASYFEADDPTVPPKVLITTSKKATRISYEFGEELVNLIPGAEFIKRKKGSDFAVGNIAAWAANRGYMNLIVLNEDTKKLNAITLVHLPNGPTAYFKLSSIEFPKRIAGHARPTAHYPELVLNNFATRLGHLVGRMFQTLFPQIPEFQGRQVVTLHNQRDFLFFRRHRYAFRSPEKAGLQEIGPRFTLKLRWVKTDIPAVPKYGAPSRAPIITVDDEAADDEEAHGMVPESEPAPETMQVAEGGDLESLSENLKGDTPSMCVMKAPPTQDEYIWMWKAELETTRRTFFL